MRNRDWRLNNLPPVLNAKRKQILVTSNINIG